MKSTLRIFSRDEGGATTIEYGVIAGAVALAVLTAFWTFGDSVQATFAEVAAAVGLEEDGESAPRIFFQTTPERD